MAYSTTTDVQNAAGGAEALKALSDYSKANAIDTSVVSSAIAEADAMIDSFIQLRLNVPLATVPDSIKFCSARLAVYFLKVRRNGLTDRDVTAYDNDIAWLERVKSGQATVGTSPLPTKSELVVDKAVDRPTDKAVSRAKLKGFA